MKATIDNEGYLKIECGSIVESMSEADLRTLAKYAVFQEVLLNGVCDALVDGDMWNDDPEPAWWMGGDAFNRLRMKLVPLLPEITCKAVQELERNMRDARAEAASWRDACWKLEREWNAAHDPGGHRNETIARAYQSPMTREQVGEFLLALESRLTQPGAETP